MTASVSLNRLLESAPYALAQAEKREALTQRVRDLSRLHYEQCAPYRNVVNRVFGGSRALDFERVEDAPFIPVSLFKTRELLSVAPDRVVKTLTSSGTTGQAVSRIYLDSETAQLQSRVLVKIMQHLLGVDRRPMILIDQAGVIRDRRSFSARAAGILGMLPFGKQPIYALHEDMSLDLDTIEAYLEKVSGRPLVLFGFTFMVWQYFVEALEKLGRRLSMPGAVLLHSGGWKKLEAMKVSQREFRARVQRVTGAKHVINYYGMVEQVGSVYVENPLHCLHASIYSDVIIRDPNTLQPVPPGNAGIIQVVSALPSSYPGHSLLTEDIGAVEGCDEPATGMGGQYFRVIGRLPKAELRGCSDTFQRAGVPESLASLA